MQSLFFPENTLSRIGAASGSLARDLRLLISSLAWVLVCSTKLPVSDDKVLRNDVKIEFPCFLEIGWFDEGLLPFDLLDDFRLAVGWLNDCLLLAG